MKYKFKKTKTMSDVDNGSQAQANPEMSDAGLEGGPEVGDPEAVGEEIDEMPEGDEEVLTARRTIAISRMVKMAPIVVAYRAWSYTLMPSAT